MFEHFSRSFQKDDKKLEKVDYKELERFVTFKLGVPVPEILINFWKTMGAGYFGDRMVYFFGDDAGDGQRDSLAEWNNKDFWRHVYPSPDQGGPVFFAETCFGDQVGFQWENGKVTYVLFLIDTFESFTLANSDAEFFDNIMSDRYALVDEDRYHSVLNRIGRLKDGMHYAPLVSPMLGGSGSSDNFCLETANVHFRTSIQTFITKAPAHF